MLLTLFPHIDIQFPISAILSLDLYQHHLSIWTLINSCTLYAIIVILRCCSSMMDSTLMTVHWNKISIWFCFFGMFVTWLLDLDAFYYKKDNRGSNVAKVQIVSLVTVPQPLPFVYLQEVYPIKQLPQTLYKTSRCYDRQLGGE